MICLEGELVIPFSYAPPSNSFVSQTLEGLLSRHVALQGLSYVASRTTENQGHCQGLLKTHFVVLKIVGKRTPPPSLNDPHFLILKWVKAIEKV